MQICSLIYPIHFFLLHHFISHVCSWAWMIAYHLPIKLISSFLSIPWTSFCPFRLTHHFYSPTTFHRHPSFRDFSFWIRLSQTPYVCKMYCFFSTLISWAIYCSLDLHYLSKAYVSLLFPLFHNVTVSWEVLFHYVHVMMCCLDTGPKAVQPYDQGLELPKLWVKLPQIFCYTDKKLAHCTQEIKYPVLRTK